MQGNHSTAAQGRPGLVEVGRERPTLWPSIRYGGPENNWHGYLMVGRLQAREWKRALSAESEFPAPG